MKRNSKKRGKGIFSDAYNKVKDIGTKLIYGRSDLSPKVQKILSEYGDEVIVGATIPRKPVTSIIQSIIRTVSSYPYDNLFHLFIELTLDNGQKWVLEKIERINLVKEDRSKKQGAEFTSTFPVNKTVDELFQNTKNRMGDRFLPYQSASNNCQVFIIGVLDGNGLNNAERTSFVKQDTKAIFEKNPALRKFANTLTDIGGYGNALIQEATKPIDAIREATKPKTIKKKLNKTMNKLNFLD